MNEGHLMRAVRRAFEGTGLKWEVIPGSKHKKLFIEGRMVLTLSYGRCPHKDIDKVKSAIHRAQEALLGQA